MNLCDPRFIRIFAPLGLVAILTACPPPPANPTVYESVLNSANVVPAITTTGGTGTATGTTNGTILTIAGDVDKLSGAIIQATLTCGAAAGANAPVGTTVKPLDFANTSTVGKGTIFGTITDGTEANRTSLNNGLCYIQVYSGASPEIRGQLIKRAGQ